MLDKQPDFHVLNAFFAVEVPQSIAAASCCTSDVTTISLNDLTKMLNLCLLHFRSLSCFLWLRALRNSVERKKPHKFAHSVKIKIIDCIFSETIRVLVGKCRILLKMRDDAVYLLVKILENVSANM